MTKPETFWERNFWRKKLLKILRVRKIENKIECVSIIGSLSQIPVNKIKKKIQNCVVPESI